MHDLAGSGDTSFLRSLKMAPRIDARRFVQILLVWVPFAYLVSTSATATEVPEVKADIGPCSAEFTILDRSGKPIYDAKIRVTVRYGFMEKRKQDLEIGTNSDGKARVTGLPIKLKRPLEYKISFAQMTKSVMSDPGVECHDKETVTLGSP